MITEFKIFEIHGSWYVNCLNKHLYPDPNCTDCKKGININGEDRFMVNDEIWNQYVEDKGDTQVCWDCLEKRIKRKLKYEDFSQYMKFPINKDNKKIQNLK